MELKKEQSHLVEMLSRGDLLKKESALVEIARAVGNIEALDLVFNIELESEEGNQ